MKLEDMLQPKNIGACVSCGKTISFDNIRVCIECDSKFRPAIRDYINSHSNATLDEVSKATGAPFNLVSYYEKKGLFHTLDNEIAKRKMEKRLISLAAKGIKQEEDMKKNIGMSGGYYFLTPERIKNMHSR
jgi:hypothetical protein